ncbi:hypothetical protein JTE90_010120 [Oedothorax gibbosus]|uniref:Uncharacterized protein n=1 Tax=Oedothorax gibbosus TaxID=931172 RepID=A0AAV6UED1_9ARAC|nr:hypothetical protein JTE90_010120 [Oedothorax gibbosus]
MMLFCAKYPVEKNLEDTNEISGRKAVLSSFTLTALIITDRVMQKRDLGNCSPSGRQWRWFSGVMDTWGHFAFI